MYDEITNEERRELGQLRARDAAFDAVHELWKEREAEGFTQKEMAEFLGRDPAWVSRTLAGPANWTLKTLGEVVEALDGILFIKAVHADKHQVLDNYDIYSDWSDSCVKMELVKSVVVTNTKSASSRLIVSPVEIKDSKVDYK